MDTPSCGSHPPGPATSPSPSDLADHAVAAAGEVVCGTWVQVLIECQNQAEAAMKAASVRCGDAERDPAAIASAHVGLEQALATARSTSHAREWARAGIALELARLFRLFRRIVA